MYYHLNNGVFPAAFRTTLEDFPLNDVVYAYEKLGKNSKFPVLIIWGELDRTVPVTCTQQAKELIPRAEVAIIPGTGHNAFAEETETITQKIFSHIDRLVKAPKTTKA